MRYYKAVIVVLAALLINSCSYLQQQKGNTSKEEAEKAALPPPLYLGTIHQVYPDQRFVLLRIIGPMPEPGTTLITHPANGSLSRIGNICVTSEKPTRNGIIAADVRAGSVLRGDRVFLYRDITTHTPKEEDNPDSAANGADDFLPKPVSNMDARENEHPYIDNSPAVSRDEMIPTPTGPDTEDDTMVEQMPEPVGETLPDKSIPLPSGSPGTAPSYLDEIPDNIDDWN